MVFDQHVTHTLLQRLSLNGGLTIGRQLPFSAEIERKLSQYAEITLYLNPTRAR